MILRLRVSVSYLLGLLFLRFAVYYFYVKESVFSRFVVSDSYVLGLVIFTFEG